MKESERKALDRQSNGERSRLNEKELKQSVTVLMTSLHFKHLSGYK